jgi:NAD(P)-dependent dehydrogenase (short-subunit alcohol dehydrogenase family)
MSRVERIEVPGPPAPRRLEDHSAESWRQAVSSVLGQSIEMAQEAVLDLLAEGGGSILLVAPAAPGDGAWRAAVAGLHGLARSIAKEYGRKGIRCNLLVGPSPELERLLAENPAVTGEMLATSDECWGAAGLR